MELPQGRPHLGRPPIFEQDVIVDEGPGEPLCVHVAFLLECSQQLIRLRARTPAVQLSPDLSRRTLGTGAPMSYLSGDSFLH